MNPKRKREIFPFRQYKVLQLMNKKILGMWAAMLLLCLGMAACNSDDDTSYEYEYFDYSDATVTSFSLDDNSHVCDALSSYSFTIDQYGTSDPEYLSGWEGAGLIFNADSLPMGSKADSIMVNLSYTSPSSVLFIHYDSLGTAVDTIDFSSDSTIHFCNYARTRLEVTAFNGTTIKNYFVKVNVHQVIGDTIRWEYAAQNLWDTERVTAQKTVSVARNLYWFTEEDSTTQYLQTSTFESNLKEDWTTATPITTPKRLDLSSIIVWGETLYAVTEGGSLCHSSDGGLTWSELSSTYVFTNLIGHTPASKGRVNTLHAIVQDNGIYHFATTTDGATWQLGATLPDSFPIKGYSSPLCTQAQPNLGVSQSRLYIVGGETVSGEMTASTWCCDGAQWAEFPQKYLPAMQGAQIIPYTLDTDTPETFWVLYPGETADGAISSLYFSENRGVTWKAMISEYDSYADNSHIAPVSGHSAVHDKQKHRMYFFGGNRADGTTCSDIITGQLTKLTFKKRR